MLVAADTAHTFGLYQSLFDMFTLFLHLSVSLVFYVNEFLDR